jgi:hypothetical protein
MKILNINKKSTLKLIAFYAPQLRKTDLNATKKSIYLNLMTEYIRSYNRG